MPTVEQNLGFSLVEFHFGTRLRIGAVFAFADAEGDVRDDFHDHILPYATVAQNDAFGRYGTTSGADCINSQRIAGSSSSQDLVK